MELNGSRFLVAGATGHLGERFARGMHERGAGLVLAGRDRESLVALGGELASPVTPLDLLEAGSAAEAVEEASRTLGGLDGILVATGTVAFGRAGEIPAEVEAELLRVNATGPMELVGAALERISPGGSVAVITAVVASFPTAGMAAYSASKAALASYLTAVRRERRRELSSVLEISPGHMETGFADRALAGEPPALPEGESVDELVEVSLRALAEGRREVKYDPKTRELVVK
jgi:short-subunit dehydrogenase